jgi:hypothetical protein
MYTLSYIGFFMDINGIFDLRCLNLYMSRWMWDGSCDESFFEVDDLQLLLLELSEYWCTPSSQPSPSAFKVRGRRRVLAIYTDTAASRVPMTNIGCTFRLPLLLKVVDTTIQLDIIIVGRRSSVVGRRWSMVDGRWSMVDGRWSIESMVDDGR